MYGEGWGNVGCGEKVINDYMKYSEKYDKVLKELMGVSKEYIDSLNAEKIFSQLRHQNPIPTRPAKQVFCNYGVGFGNKSGIKQWNN